MDAAINCFIRQGNHEKGRHVLPNLSGSHYAKRNYWKADLVRGKNTLIKDYGKRTFIVRLFGRLCLRWEEAALKRLKGIEGIPSFESRPTPYSLKMTLVPGVPIDKLIKGQLSEAFLKNLTLLFNKIHERGVAHGDAHQRNILAFHDKPYLVDFSTSYVKGRSILFDRFIFRCFILLDMERVYKIEKKFFERGTPPNMFFLYRIIKGSK